MHLAAKIGSSAGYFFETVFLGFVLVVKNGRFIIIDGKQKSKHRRQLQISSIFWQWLVGRGGRG